MTAAERELLRRVADLDARLRAAQDESKRLEREIRKMQSLPRLGSKTSIGRYERAIKRLRARLYKQTERAELWKHRALRKEAA